MTIPNVIYFCNKTIDSKMRIQTYKWKLLNKKYIIKLYDDDMCECFLLNNYSRLYYDIFKFLKDGPIKSDFWRICILYKFGGVYADVDIFPLESIKNFMENDIDLLTCSSYWNEMNFNFNPNFIIAKPNNIFLKECILWYINKYNNNTPYDYWGWSIMQAFTDVIKLEDYNKDDGIYYYKQLKIQILKEYAGDHHYDAHNMYKNVRLFNNRSNNWNDDTHSFR
jgi:mannosyltransferase OCH1-like enzyme